MVMKMNILVISDTHGELQRCKEVIQAHPNMDYYIDLGDVGFELTELDGFTIVKGNHDRFTKLPSEKILQIEDRTILCIHGDYFEKESVEEVMAMKSEPGLDLMHVCMEVFYRHIAEYAKKRNCDTVLFGHTHVKEEVEYDGVLLINPGSLAYGLMGDDHSYALLELHGKQVQVTFCDAT